MKKLAVIGSTGSIGRQAAEIARRYPDDLKIELLSCKNNVSLLSKQAEIFRPAFCSIADERLKGSIEESSFLGTKFYYGKQSLIQLMQEADYDIVLIASSGAEILQAAAAAAKRGKIIALATKEILVSAGLQFTQLVKKYGATLLPVDSEHSAVYQCLKAGRREELSSIILTASGGSFRDYTAEQLKTVTVEQALHHPNWSMGKKITVDSATMMNKGLEVIEAKWLFNLPLDKINTVLHRESIIHSMAEFVDGSVIAQMSVPSMDIPIQYALLGEKRQKTAVPSLNLAKLKTLTFEELDRKKYPCFDIALSAAENGGLFPAIMNAANEEAVEAFLSGRIKFTEISYAIERGC